MSIGKKRRNTDEADIDVTAFMNLMIVLVPVLLLSMTFMQITVFNIALPELTGGSSASDEEQSKLEVEINEDNFKVYYPTKVLIQTVPLTKDGDGEPIHDFRRLSLVLQEVKTKLKEKQKDKPKDKRKDKDDIVILSHADTPYETLIATMDTAKSYKTVIVTDTVEIELFPNISLGDARR